MQSQVQTTSRILLDGVVISWRDTRQMVHSEPDDMEMIGDFKIGISATSASVKAIAGALICAQTLEKAAEQADMFCPHSDARLRAIGLSNIGSVVLQIFKGDRKCSAVPVSDMAHMDPAQYSNGGEEAMKSIAWMRDVATALRDYHDALCGHGAPDLDALHYAVSATKADSVSGAVSK